MAQNDLFKRYLDTGLAFTAVTQARAEALVKDLVKAGEVQADQAREVISELVDRSRKNSEQLLETVRREVKQQITSLGLVSKADLDKAEARIATLMGTASAPVRKVAESGSKAAAKAAGQASSAAKQASGATKKTSAKAAPAKQAAAAKKAPAKKAPATKAPAKKAPAKKA